MASWNDRPLRPWQVLAGSLILAASAHARVPLASATPAGIVKIPMHVRADTPRIELSPEGKLIVAATVSDPPPEGVLFRFSMQGKPDPSFGEEGRVLIRRDGAIPLHALVTQALTVQPDGKIVVAGEAYPDPENGADFVLMRHLPDGRLDPQFGQGGQTTVRLGSTSEDVARAVQQDRAGRIVVAGRANAQQATSAIGVVRLDARGRLDTPFGRNGKAPDHPGRRIQCGCTRHPARSADRGRRHPVPPRRRHAAQ